MREVLATPVKRMSWRFTLQAGTSLILKANLKVGANPSHPFLPILLPVFIRVPAAAGGFLH